MGDMIKIEDESEEKSASLAEHDLLSNQIREKLLSNKSEKVRCENCNKSLKNSIILQYHQLHCAPTPGHKSEKKATSSSSSGQLPGAAAVEKKIIDSKRSNASPVDMILKKLKAEKVQSSPSPSSATISSPVSSPGSSSYKFFKSKGGDEKSVDPPVKKSWEEEDAASKKMKDHIKSCHDKQILVSMKKISSSEIEKSPTTGKPSKSQKSPTKPLDSEAATPSSPTLRKPEKKESSKAPSLKSPPLKSNVKTPKSKEEVPKPAEKTVKKSPAGRPAKKKTAAKKNLSCLSSDSDSDGKAKKKRKSYTEDSDSDDDSEFEVKKKKRKPTLYCFETCFEEESNEMIG